jgi:hypothetical protein
MVESDTLHPLSVIESLAETVIVGVGFRISEVRTTHYVARPSGFQKIFVYISTKSTGTRAAKFYC